MQGLSSVCEDASRRADHLFKTSHTSTAGALDVKTRKYHTQSNSMENKMSMNTSSKKQSKPTSVTIKSKKKIAAGEMAAEEARRQEFRSLQPT